MTTPAFTPGPWTVEPSIQWPYDIKTFDCKGMVIFSTSLPFHTSKVKTLEDALNCVHFGNRQEREECKAANHRALADEYLRGAAPELFEALQMLCGDDPVQSFCIHDTERHANGRAKGTWGLAAMDKARAALKKATGETK